jgi:shikimate kinase
MEKIRRTGGRRAAFIDGARPPRQQTSLSERAIPSADLMTVTPMFARRLFPHLTGTDTRDRAMMHLVGPGGAGKTTIGTALAEGLGVSFVDLDQQFSGRFGDISMFLKCHGYEAYAPRNVQLYLDLARSSPVRQIMALSSGFMTYPAAVHPDYSNLRHAIATSPSTGVLLPSFDCETCVAETVRRQMSRPFSRGAAREEEVIGLRFSLYMGLVAPKFETMRPIGVIVDDLRTLWRLSTLGSPAPTRLRNHGRPRTMSVSRVRAGPAARRREPSGWRADLDDSP